MNNLFLLLSACVLVVGALFLFFGGTWEGVRFGLEIAGAGYLISFVFEELKKDKMEKTEKKELEKEADKYFNN